MTPAVTGHSNFTLSRLLVKDILFRYKYDLPVGDKYDLPVGYKYDLPVGAKPASASASASNQELDILVGFAKKKNEPL